MVKARGGKYILKILPWSRPLLLELAIGNWKIFITNNKKVSFALLWPAGYVNFTCRGGARPTFCWAWQPAFPLGRASIPDMDPVVNDEVGTEGGQKLDVSNTATNLSPNLVNIFVTYFVITNFGDHFGTIFGEPPIWCLICHQICHQTW